MKKYLEARSKVETLGYCNLKDFPWSEAGISIQAIAETIDYLQSCGFPPVFIFMYDQPWLLFESLFEPMSIVLDSADLQLDASVFAWALQALKPEVQIGQVGSNFGMAHRDYSFTNCHTADGKLSILTVWIPLVPVTLDNGCMYVVLG